MPSPWSGQVGQEFLEQLQADFIEAFQCIVDYEDQNRRLDFVCHDTVYLALRYLERKGHDYLDWRRGSYRCKDPTHGILHSWISSFHFPQSFICETDCHQL